MDEALATHRSKRQKVDKHGRFSALERFKQLKEKGVKYKYELNDVDNVYDEVEESEYSKKVLSRQCDDWIVEDGQGSGYVEDGREIFDDDLDNESIQEASKRESKGPRKRKRDDNKGRITSMFNNIKKKAEEKSTNDDDILGDLMSELKKGSNEETQNKKPTKNKFVSKPKNERTNDDKLLENLINESKKPTKKVNDDSDIYVDPVKRTNTLPIVKKVETLQSKVKINPSEENSNYAHDQSFEIPVDEFTAGDFSDVNEPTHNISKNNLEVNDVQNNDKMEDLIGDITDADFEENVEMGSNTSLINIPNLQKTQLNNSRLFKDDDIELPNDDVFVKSWEENFSVKDFSQDFYTQSSIDVKTLTFPKVTDENGEKVFRFFWYDAFEDQYKQPGVVYLFGKVYIESLKEYMSTCVAVKNIPRKIYILPRDTVKNDLTGEEEENTMENVYNEFNEYTKKVGINQFRFREVSKKYAFEREDTPVEADYLEVNYSANDPAMASNYSGRFIEGVFGTTTSSLESLLIERNIKGPCWLDIKEPLPMENSFSWCKTQVHCLKMNNISVTPEQSNMSTPPIVLATINVQVSLDTGMQKNEVVMIGVLLHHKFSLDKAPPKPPFDQHYCFITHPKNTPWPLYMKDKLSKITKTTVIRCENELELLEKFLDKLQESEPDLIIGYDCEFQFDVLLSRIFTLKIKNWSKTGKLKRMAQPFFKGKIIQNNVFCGRPICDIMSSAKELNLKVKSYDLASLCVAVLKKNESECKEVKPEECQNYYSSIDKLEKLIYMVMTHASFILNIVTELNILPLALQITNICGNILSRTFSAGRSERNEFLLLHAFHNKGFITPDKHVKENKKENETTGKKKPQYLGGLVLEPKAGFYDKLVLLMDFNSLYPSIIQEYNLCFTTVPGAAYADLEDLELPNADLEPGIVPTEIRKLVQSRVEVKKLMKIPNISPELRIQYDIRQLALKLTANSMYGCLGASHNRFYAKGLAALVTSKGREILQNTKALVEKENYDVIYGDTDSIMINSNILDYDQVFTIGKEIKQKVNKLYKKVELDIDGVFKYLLMLKKKKYAAVSITKLPNGEFKFVREMKGLDIVRRDWCSLACDVGKQVLDFLLSDKQTESRIDCILELLQRVSNNLREGKEKLVSLVITKQLSKNPSEYPSDKKGQLSHVLVAQRLNGLGGRMWKKGDVIPYIVCEDGTDRSATERVYHIDEFKKSDTLKIDVNYYLLSQIHPVVLRICNPIDGIDDVLLAENLGIKDFKSSRKIHSNEENEVPLSARDNRFEKCVPLRFLCKNENCKSEIEIKTVFTDYAVGTKPSLSMCSNPACNLAPFKYVYAIENKIRSEIRRFLRNYYSGEVECENPICSKVMRRITLDTFGHYPKCYDCKDGNVYRIYGETDLYNQLSFYLYLFTLTPTHYKALKTPLSRELIAVYDTLKEFAENQIQCNAYSVVDLTKLFWSEVQESDIDADTSKIENIVPLEVEDLDVEEEEFLENEDVD